MKKLLHVLFFVFGICSLAAQTGLSIGGTLPKGDLKLKEVSGNLITLNEIKGSNGLIVIFGANTCSYMIRTQARITEICNYAIEKGIAVIILNSNDANRSGTDSYSRMQEYAKAQDFRWKYAVDSHSEIADAFGANRTPECYLFDASARLIYHGAIDDSPADEKQVNRQHLREAINEWQSGKEISIKESHAAGCTIQRNR